MSGNRSSRRALPWLAGAVLLLVAAHLLDRWAFAALAYNGVYEHDWGRLLRIMGFAPTWLLAAAALWLEGRGGSDGAGPRLRATAGTVVIAVALGGLGAEALKLLIRRERPDGSGLYLFRSFTDHPFSTGRLGMPSSHTMVAFAGAAVLARRFPRAAPILYGLAAGCGLTRLMAQAHFLSDVVAGALGGAAAGRWTSRRLTSAAGPS